MDWLVRGHSALYHVRQRVLNGIVSYVQPTDDGIMPIPPKGLQESLRI